MSGRRAPRPGELLARLRPSPEERPPFLEGLVLGALVGAAIAGSTLWARIHEARRTAQRVAMDEDRASATEPG